MQIRCISKSGSHIFEPLISCSGDVKCSSFCFSILDDTLCWKYNITRLHLWPGFTFIFFLRYLHSEKKEIKWRVQIQIMKLKRGTYFMESIYSYVIYIFLCNWLLCACKIIHKLTLHAWNPMFTLIANVFWFIGFVTTLNYFYKQLFCSRMKGFKILVTTVQCMKHTDKYYVINFSQSWKTDTLVTRCKDTGM